LVRHQHFSKTAMRILKMETKHRTIKILIIVRVFHHSQPKND